MSDPKRVYTKLEQSSLRLALGDSSLRSAIHCPQCHRLDAFNFNKLKNNNFGYRCESRTSLNGSVRPPGCGKTVASGYIHEAIFQLTGVDILTSDDHFARVASAAPEERITKTGPRLSGPSTTRRTIVRSIPAYTPAAPSRRPTARETADQRNADARAAQRLAEAEHLDAENARQENSELHQLRTSPSVDDHVEEHIEDWADCMDEEDACGTPYHNFSPSPQYRPVLGVRHSMHATSAENVRSATPPPASESFVPRASPVQDPSLSRILDMLQSENAALRAQIADLTKQLTLFLSRENQRTKPAQPKSSAQVPAASPGPSTETPQPSATEAAPPVHNAAPETEAPNKRPRVSYAEKLKSSFPNASTEKLRKATSALQGLTTHRKKLPTADRLQLVYVGGILRKPIREVKQNLMDLGFDTRASSIANISFLGASTCELLMAPGAASHFKRKIKEIDCPNLRILENFDAAKAADPKASSALKSTLVNSYTKRIHSVISREGASPEVRKFFSALLASQSLPLPTESPRDNEDEIPLSATPMETDDQSDAQPSKETDGDEPTVPMETNTSPVPAEAVNPQSTGPAETSSGYSEPHVPTVVPAQTNTAISTVPSIESESLLDIAPLQSNE
ncbi:hypothetical protein DSO57_1028585 [Entomophthora muscae]|uniref:Uncharacterized protein n=1 Tax=Entomophthora muscae TaxID=34485 RepID=A0ACC2TNW2_9FUNG|nr:hypothetical protein DSO57_1028585 [Entomophthora muscae]